VPFATNPVTAGVNGEVSSKERRAMAAHTPYYFEVYGDAAGKLRWRFWAPNGRIMADSGQGYARKQSCIAGINELSAETVAGVSIVYHPSAASAA
jgi:uncharacterized protein YegP (UPF0339 family)